MCLVGQFVLVLQRVVDRKAIRPPGPFLSLVLSPLWSPHLISLMHYFAIPSKFEALNRLQLMLAPGSVAMKWLSARSMQSNIVVVWMDRTKSYFDALRLTTPLLFLRNERQPGHTARRSTSLHPCSSTVADRSLSPNVILVFVSPQQKLAQKCKNIDQPALNVIRIKCCSL